MVLDFMVILEFMVFSLLTDFLLHNESRFYGFSVQTRFNFMVIFCPILGLFNIFHLIRKYFWLIENF